MRVIQAPDALRNVSGHSLAETMRARVRSAITDLQRHGYGLAAFFADSIFSSDGIFPDPAGFLAPILEEVHRAGGLYVADEVQSGFARTGDHWWGFQRHHIRPDIVTLGKPMGNGLPISAAVFRGEIARDFGARVRYFNTFGGNTVCIAAAQAVLDVLRDDDLMKRAATTGARLRTELRALLSSSGRVAEVRGAGLFLGIDLVTDPDSLTPDPDLADTVVNTLRARRVLISATGPAGNVLKIRPPLAFDDADADRFLEVFAAVAADMHID